MKKLEIKNFLKKLKIEISKAQSIKPLGSEYDTNLHNMDLIDSEIENEVKTIINKAIKCQKELNDFWEDAILEAHQNECPEIGFDENATTHDKCKGSKKTHPPLKSLINKFFEAN